MEYGTDEWDYHESYYEGLLENHEEIEKQKDEDRQREEDRREEERNLQQRKKENKQ